MVDLSAQTKPVFHHACKPAFQYVSYQTLLAASAVYPRLHKTVQNHLKGLALGVLAARPLPLGDTILLQIHYPLATPSSPSSLSIGSSICPDNKRGNNVSRSSAKVRFML